jgi:hypothetical protein
MRRRDVLGLASATASGFACAAHRVAQSAWPSTNITLVVPFTPGGLTDILARSVGEKIAPILGRPVVVDNRPGAGGSIGAASVARSAPDGHTLLLGHIGILAVNSSLYANLQYDPLAMSYIAPLAIVPNIIVVHPSVPVHSIKELIDYAKANPGKLNFSSAGTGGAAHIAMAAFNVASGTAMTHVPYRGTPQSVGDVISGQVQATFTRRVAAAARASRHAARPRCFHPQPADDRAGHSGHCRDAAGLRPVGVVRHRRSRRSAGAGCAEAARGNPQGDGVAGHRQAVEHRRRRALGCVAAGVSRVRRGGDEALEVGDRGGEHQDRVGPLAFPFVPAKAGIQGRTSAVIFALGSRLRGNERRRDRSGEQPPARQLRPLAQTSQLGPHHVARHAAPAG